MRKIYALGLAVATIASFSACNKESKSADETVSRKVTVKASTEAVLDPSTKVSISESGSTFTLNWEGTETFVVSNSVNNSTSRDKNTFSIDNYSGKYAEFIGDLPSVTSGTVNYIASFNWISSTDNYVRAEVPATQVYSDDGMLTTNCLLVARADDCAAGTLESLDFKTMNAFIKFSLKKGEADSGSSNDYSKMYVQSIKVETIQDGEPIAGRFGFNKTGEWGSKYDEVVSAEKKSAVMLNCVTDTYLDGVELTENDTPFYVAVAFGEYSQGLKVTISVKNQNGDYGTYERTISKGTNYSIERNTLISMPSLIVNPVDENVETYTLIDRMENLQEGEYFMCALKEGIYRAFTGTFASGNGVTEDISYNQESKKLDFNKAVSVTLSSTGVPNQYKISWNVSNGVGYLKGTANNKLAYDTNEANAEFWTASNGSSNGIFMTGSVQGGTLKSAESASSNYIRSYGANNMAVGIFFFKKD